MYLLQMRYPAVGLPSPRRLPEAEPPQWPRVHGPHILYAADRCPLAPIRRTVWLDVKSLVHASCQ